MYCGPEAFIYKIKLCILYLVNNKVNYSVITGIVAYLSSEKTIYFISYYLLNIFVGNTVGTSSGYTQEGIRTRDLLSLLVFFFYCRCKIKKFRPTTHWKQPYMIVHSVNCT